MLRGKFDAVRDLPNFLFPRYFAIIVQVSYNAAWKRGIHLLGDNVRHGQEFIHQLAMVSVQQTGYGTGILWPTEDGPQSQPACFIFVQTGHMLGKRYFFISIRGLCT